MSKSILLWQGLSVELSNPCLRSVSRDDDQWQSLIESLSHRRSHIEQCCSRRNTDSRWFSRCQNEPKCEKSRTTLIRDRKTPDLPTQAEIVYDGGITASRAHHGLPHPMSEEKGCQYVYVLFITIHLYLFRAKRPSSLFYPPFPSILPPVRCPPAIRLPHKGYIHRGQFSYI